MKKIDYKNCNALNHFLNNFGVYTTRNNHKLNGLKIHIAAKIIQLRADIK